VRRDRAPARELPAARREAERLARQGADRAEVDHVAGELGVHRAPDEAHDLGVFPPIDHAELHHAADLLAEAHAPGAVDAAGHALGGDERAHRLLVHDPLGLAVARARGAVADREVLELAFAALVADRTV